MKMLMLAMMGALVVLGAATSAEARRYDSDDDDWEERAPRRVQQKPRPQHVQRKETSQRAPRKEATQGALPKEAAQQVEHKETPKVVKTARVIQHSVGPRPGAWCGWWMRTRRGGGPEYNLAWNWSRWGKPAQPQVGAVVVWRHHVGEITGRTKSGQWIVRSGNDGGRVRERMRSVAGAVFRI